MSRDTTLYIHKFVLEKIDSAVTLCGIKRNQIIHLLFKYAMNDFKSLVRENITVKYQEQDDADLWETTHVWYNEDVYCFVNMMRFLYRMSMSLILAYSVRKHLYSIIERLLRIGIVKTDNYLFQKYEFGYDVTDNKIFWKKYWVKQRKKE